MRLLLILSFLLTGCSRPSKQRYINCEEPYYKGYSKRVFVNSDGTLIISEDGTIYEYPPSVKCEVKRQKR